MLWNLILEPGKKYTSSVKESFHLSMATLDVQPEINDNEIFPVQLEINGQKLLLCNLAKPHYLHANLDLNFKKGTELTFSTNDKATIHLTGYLVTDEPEEKNEEVNTSFKTDESTAKIGTNTKKQDDGDFILKKLINMLNTSLSKKRKLDIAKNKVKKKANYDNNDLSENDEKENNSNDESDGSTLDKLDMDFSSSNDNDNYNEEDKDDDDDNDDDKEEEEEDDEDENDDNDDDDDEDDDTYCDCNDCEAGECNCDDSEDEEHTSCKNDR